jgi:hypothetical protein
MAASGVFDEDDIRRVCVVAVVEDLVASCRTPRMATPALPTMLRPRPESLVRIHSSLLDI